MRLTPGSWSAADARTRRRVAARVVEQLPDGWSLDEVEPQGEAWFRAPDGAEHVLIPGGTARLGFNAEDFHPSAQLQAAWDAMRGLVPAWATQSLAEHIDAMTSNPREMELPALVVEVAAQEQGWRHLPGGDPAAQRMLPRGPWQPHERLRNPGWGDRTNALEVRTGATPGQYEVYERCSITHAEVVRQLAAEGARLPTADEWEYCCGDMSNALFRWGNTCPVDLYPDDVTPERFAPLCRSTRWGLWMTTNTTYDRELVAEAELRLGGDGGVRIGGSAPALEVWLVLATAFRERQFPVRENVHGCLARRVIAVE